MVNREPASVGPAGEMSNLHKSHKILYFLFSSLSYLKVWNCGGCRQQTDICSFFLEQTSEISAQRENIFVELLQFNEEMYCGELK